MIPLILTLLVFAALFAIGCQLSAVRFHGLSSGCCDWRASAACKGPLDGTLGAAERAAEPGLTAASDRARRKLTRQGVSSWFVTNNCLSFGLSHTNHVSISAAHERVAIAIFANCAGEA